VRWQIKKKTTTTKNRKSGCSENQSAKSENAKCKMPNAKCKKKKSVCIHVPGNKLVFDLLENGIVEISRFGEVVEHSRLEVVQVAVCF
jgi:hypothetical protein